MVFQTLKELSLHSRWVLCCQRLTISSVFTSQILMSINNFNILAEYSARVGFIIVFPTFSDKFLSFWHTDGSHGRISQRKQVGQNHGLMPMPEEEKKSAVLPENFTRWLPFLEDQLLSMYKIKSRGERTHPGVNLCVGPGHWKWLHLLKPTWFCLLKSL